MNDSLIVYIFFILLIVGILTGRYAARKGYGRIWFFLGLLFGLSALIVLFFLPNKKKEKQKTPPNPSLVNHAFSQVQWFYLDSLNQQIGPISFPQLVQAWKEKTTHANSYVWSEDLANWEIIENLPDLKKELLR